MLRRTTDAGGTSHRLDFGPDGVRKKASEAL